MLRSLGTSMSEHDMYCTYLHRIPAWILSSCKAKEGS